jgi:hypothetical protein
MKSGKALCLNMIVKNETANLDRCLTAVAPYISCWIIGDTGSTDGTREFIRSFFAARNIPGELFSLPFVNFAQRATRRSTAPALRPCPSITCCWRMPTWSCWCTLPHSPAI